MEGLFAVILAGVVCWLFFAPPKVKVEDGVWPVRARRPLSDLERDYLEQLQAKLPEHIVLPCPRLTEFIGVRADVKGRRRFERRLLEYRGSLLVCDRFYEPKGVVLIEQQPKPASDPSIKELSAVLNTAGLRLVRLTASGLSAPELVAGEIKNGVAA